MKQIFQQKETDRIVWNQYKLSPSVPKVNQVSYGEKFWDVMGLKSRLPFRFMSRLVKILELSQSLLKFGMVLHVTAECVRVDLD